MTDVIIVGAGAAGLSAARILSSRYAVTVLEARDRIGGRIHTITDEGFSKPVEAGAEFIHGELKHTMSLMKEAGVSYYEGKGRTWNIEDGKLVEGSLFHMDWNVLMEKLGDVKRDMTMADFLTQYFPGPAHQSLTDGVKRFVQGYDAADIHKISAKALYEEWSGEDIKGYRPVGGYGQLMHFLMDQIQNNKGVIKLSTPVKKIKWQGDYVEVTTDKEMFSAKKAIITVPVNVLKAGSIFFEPSIGEHMVALQKLETGGVIKFLIEFKDAIWQRESESVFRKMPGMNFLFSDAYIPTWWTQNPAPFPLLTGWLAGPALSTVPRDDHALLNHAFETLAYFFKCNISDIQHAVRTAKVFNWATGIFAQGAYAYKTLETTQALKTISQPINDTLYFAGEAYYDGPEMGTVEAALASGIKAAQAIH